MVDADPNVTASSSITWPKSTTISASSRARPGIRTTPCDRRVQASGIREKLSDANPAVTDFQYGLAVSQVNVGNLLRTTGRYDEALRGTEQAREIQQRLVDTNPNVTEFVNYLAEIHNNIGVAQGQTGHPDDALRSFVQASGIRQKLADANPAVTDFQYGLAVSHINIGNLLRTTGSHDEALRWYERASRSDRGWPASILQSAGSSTDWPRATTTSASC